MADGKKEATHSLRTEIEMLFESQGTSDVKNEVDEISQKVYDLVEPVKALTKAFEELDDSPLNNLVKSLDNFSLDSTEVNADNLRTVLEDKIATAITKSKIKFIGDSSPERYPFEVRMGDKFWEKNQKNITEAMAKAFSNFVVDVDDIPPLDNREILKEFQTKFNEQIVELIKDEDVFSLYKKNTEKGIKEYKYKRKFKLNEKAVNEIMGAIEGQFISVLSNPENIELDEIPKLRIKSAELKQAILKIQESIGDIDSLVGVDVDALKDLPNIEEKLIKFRSNLDKMIRQINLLAVQLESITFGKATEEDVKNSIKTIQNLKDKTTIQLDKWVMDIATEIQKNLDIRPDLGKFKESVTTLNTYFETVFQTQLDVFKEDVDKVLANLKVDKEDGGVEKDLLKGKQIDITQAILDIITDSLLAEEIPIELDMGLVDELILSWSEDFTVELNKQLADLTDTILDGMGDVFDVIQSRIDIIVSNTVEELDSTLVGGDNFFRKEDLKKLMSDIETKMYSCIISTLTNATIKGTEVTDVEFELPKSFNRDVQRIVDKSIRGYMKQVIDEYKEIGGRADKKEIDESVAKLDKKATVLINAILREVNQTLTDIRKEFLHKDSGWAESTKNLKNVFNKNIRSLTTSYTKALEDSINTIIINEDNIDHIQKQISKQVIDNINNAHITTLGGSVEMDLSYEKWMDKIRETFEDAIEKWTPHITLDEMIDEQKVSKKIGASLKKAIESNIIVTTEKYLNALNSSRLTGGSDAGSTVFDSKGKKYTKLSQTKDFLTVRDDEDEKQPHYVAYRDEDNSVADKWAYMLSDEDYPKSDISFIYTKPLSEIPSGIDLTKLLDSINKSIADVVQKQIDLTATYLQDYGIDVDNQELLDIDELMGKIDPLIKDAVLARIDQVSISGEGEEKLNIDLVKPTKKALKGMEKAINETIKNEIAKFIDGGEDEKLIELNLRTKQLQKNINSLVQKIVNEKAKQVTAYGNELASAIELDKEGFDRLKENMDNVVDSMLVGYEIAAENFADGVFSEEEVNKVYTKLVNSFADSFTILTDRLLEGIEGVSTGEFNVSSKKIHPKIKKALAEYYDVSVGEFTEAFPVISGKEAQKVLMRKNVELIVSSVNDVINDSVRATVSSYQDSIKELDIEPDSSLVDYVYDQLIKLQDSVVSKAKRMVRDQFKFLTEEIKAMNIDAKSMGYKPTQAFSKEVMKANPALAEQVATATSMENLVKVLDDAVKEGDVKIETASLQGADVTAQEVDVNSTDTLVDSVDKLTTNASSVIVDGKVVDLKVDKFPVDSIVAPIQNYLEEGLPFSVDPEITPYLSNVLQKLTPQHFLSSNVFKRGYDPFDIDKLLFKQEVVKPYEGLFKGITSNMAKYFMVGYMMRLPIKAITEANKVATELDYHTAKARQNILIKDPEMTGVARDLMYNKYKAEGKDVKSSEFKSDVDKEATNLRNIMNNEMPDYLLNIAKAYQQEISDVGRFYSIASRKSKNPYEALTKTREIAKISAAEEDLDTDFAATGIEALTAQWGVNIGELDRYTNMLLKTAMLSNTTVTDLLMTQRDTAAMFKSRLTGVEDEEAFATAMALSSMFVEATGKSGRESGTFWRNVLQRPYVKDSRKFLEEASKMKGFEDLDPYYKDENGNRVQKDFLTMFSNILETAIKVDDPSAMTVLSEVFPIRTIGGAESIKALVDDLKIDLEKSIDILKDMGELDEDVTIETVDVKEVIEKYVKNIMEVTDEDIGMYIAGLQDTTQFAVKGLQTQWQTTVYSVFKEFKEENSAAMTYLTAILRMFEEGANKLSEVLSLFARIGVGVLGESLVKRVRRKVLEIPQKPTDVQKAMAEKYVDLQAKEKSFDLKRRLTREGLSNYKQYMNKVSDDIDIMHDERQQLHSFISDKEGKEGLSDAEKDELTKAIMQRDMYDDQIIKLKNTYNQIEKHMQRLSSDLAKYEQAYQGTVELGRFLGGSMGAKNVDELRNSFANFIRNEDIYTEIAPIVMKGKLDYSDEWYTQLHDRKSEIEGMLLNQQREMFRHFTDFYGNTSDEVLESILGEDFGDPFYMLENRLSEETIKATRRIGKHMEFDQEYSNMRKSFEKTYKELNGINSELVDLNTKRLEVERVLFEAERPNVTGYTKVDGVSLPITEPKTTDQLIESYREMLPVLGINVDDFEGGLDRLASMFKDGSLDVDEYEDSLREVAAQLGIADRDFDSFKVTVRRLNDEIKLGKKEIYEYIAALDAASTKSGKIKAKSITKDSEGKDVSDVETAAPEDAGKNVLKAGVLGSVLGKGKEAAKAGEVAKGASAASKVAGKFKGVGIALAAGGKALVSKTGHLMALLAVTDALGAVTGGLVEKTMTASERLSLEADKLESTINKATGWKIDEEDSKLKKFGKIAASYSIGGYNAIKNQMNKWTGGTAPSAKETWDIWREVRKNPKKSRDELGMELKDKYDVTLKRYKANYDKQREYMNKNPFIDPLTGELRDKNDPLLANLPLEELMDFMDRKTKELNKALTESDALFTKEKVHLLMNGLSNNSAEMRKAIKNHLDRNIEEMTRLVNELKDYLPRLVPGSDSYTTMWLQITDLENRIAESELQKFETNFSAFDEIMEKYNRKSSLIQSKYDIKKYDAILSGIKKDSTALKQIEKKMAEEQVRMISGIQSKLESLKRQYEDKPEQRDKLLIQIQELEADKKRILADIKDKMSEGLSTFNLPSGIKPITYYEAMTRNNTHKNITVGAGDAIVNVNIANMSGSDKDIDKLGRAVGSAVAQAQKNFVRQFANDVKSGMGNNYYSWNNY